MDRQVVLQKLDSLRRCIQRIEAKCPADVKVLQADVDLQDIVALNLSRAVQLAVDIGAHLIAVMDVPPPGTMGQTFELLGREGVVDASLAERLKKAVGFRNIAVHSYESIDWAIVHKIARDHLHEFSDYAGAVLRWLQR